MSGPLFIAATVFGLRDSISFLAKNMRMRRDMLQTLEEGKSDIRRRHLKGKPLADQPGELGMNLRGHLQRTFIGAVAAPRVRRRSSWEEIYCKGL